MNFIEALTITVIAAGLLVSCVMILIFIMILWLIRKWWHK